MDATAPPTRSDRRAAGRDRRRAVPRRSLGAWVPAADRPDPVSILEGQATTRIPELVPIRYGRMSASPFAFLRGAAAVMAADLAPVPASGIVTQLCGDAHLSNFGLFATAERNLVFDLNDFDETLPGPFEWDVCRLVASIVVAGRDKGMAGDTVDDSVRAAMRSYRSHLAAFAELRTLDLWYARVDVDAVLELVREAAGQKALERSERRVAKAQSRDSLQALAKLTAVVDGRRLIVDDPPLVVRLPDEHRDRVDGLYRSYLATLPEEVRILLDRFRVVDVARKVVGVGSVGTRVWIVLLEGQGDDDPLFLQLKEAQASVLEAHLAPSAYDNHAERVVHGQRLMQAAGDLFLGWSHEAVSGVDYYWRQLRDMKGSVDIPTLRDQLFPLYVEVCGWVLARAHARAGDAAVLTGYVGTGGAFDEAMVAFGRTYADQTERDHEALLAAIKQGRVQAELGV